MSLTPSPRLSLKRNEGSDPFLRQDFTDNWDKLDLSPGTHICTSGSRPTWGSAQAGRLIYESDLRRILAWSGVAWVEPLQVAPAWGGSMTMNSHHARGTTSSWTVATITSTRPGTLVVFTTAQLAVLPLASQQGYAYGLIDGVNRTFGSSVANRLQWPDNNTVGAAFDHRTVSIHSWAAITAGAHTIGVQLNVGTLSNQAVYIGGVAFTAILTNTSAT